MTYRDELVQVAAVAMAMIEDLDTGLADRSGLAQVMKDVTNERLRQDQKWGAQHHDPAVWIAILMEEVGEAAEELMETEMHPGVVKLVADVVRLGARSEWLLKNLIDPAGEAAAAERTI